MEKQMGEPLTMETIQALAEQALKEIPPRVKYYADQLGVTYGRITVRNQTTKWGSCTAKGNLNFNCLLMLAPREVLDSVIVHELAHRKHMDHSKQFYEEVPEAKDKFRIINIDGKGYTGGYGYAVVEAAKKAQKGASVAEIETFIRDWVDNCVIFFGMYSLQYAKKSGRIPAAAAFVGEIMGLRPVSRIQHNQITTEAKVRGDKALIPKILELTAGEQIPKTPYCIVYGNDTEVRDEMIQAMTKKLGYPPADTYQIGSEIAVNAGPKVIGVIFKSQNK